MTSYKWFLSLFIVTVSFGASADRQPNFVFILADDLGYGDLSGYGHPTNRTPHLDRLAREGLSFTDFHSNGPMCSPTRAALLTGMYQNRLGRVFESALSPDSADVGIPASVTTIPKLLKEAGYTTGMYGKWHLGYQAPYTPTYLGFDDFRGLLTGDGDHVSHISRSGREDWYHNEDIEMEEGYSTELITQHSIDFIRDNRDKPFFLYVSHLAIHFPWQGPEESAHRELGGDYWNLTKLGPHPEGSVKPVVQAMVEAVDDSVGKIMATLRELNLEGDTFVFFTSDNGGYLEYAGKFKGEVSSNGPFRGQKTDLWEGGHRVPAIAWWPGRIEAGMETGETAMTMDMLPTYASLAGVTAPVAIDGVSLNRLLFKNAPLKSRDVFWRAGEDWAVRRGAWKLVGTNRGAQLYHLDSDPGERKDVSHENPSRAKSMLKALRKWEKKVDKGVS